MKCIEVESKARDKSIKCQQYQNAVQYQRGLKLCFVGEHISITDYFLKLFYPLEFIFGTLN